MTTASPIPATEAAPRMADPSDTTAEAPAEQAPARTKASQARPTLRSQIAENPLLTLFGTIIIALLVFGLGTINFRIDDINDRFDDVHARIDDVHARIDGLEDRMDRLEDRMASLEQRVIEIDRKLTALIAHLNATESVDAALEGRLTGSDDTGNSPGP